MCWPHFENVHKMRKYYLRWKATRTRISHYCVLFAFAFRCAECECMPKSESHCTMQITRSICGVANRKWFKAFCVAVPSPAPSSYPRPKNVESISTCNRLFCWSSLSSSSSFSKLLPSSFFIQFLHDPLRLKMECNCQDNGKWTFSSAFYTVRSIISGQKHTRTHTKTKIPFRGSMVQSISV